MYKYILIIGLLFGISCSANVKETENIRLKAKAKTAKDYCVKNNMNLDVCILVDMQIHSGKKRFFLWDLKGDSILKSGMCSHGSCDNGWSEDETKSDPHFSNVPESHCSSLGKYKLGSRGYSSFGIHINYKLHGLEKTNNNAFKRIIVFHSWNAIEDDETYPVGIAESWGCPAVSNNFMREMDAILKVKKKPVLFWIFK
jgi:hypothetical protein